VTGELWALIGAGLAGAGLFTGHVIWRVKRVERLVRDLAQLVREEPSGGKVEEVQMRFLGETGESWGGEPY
jgi:hypothetical protein